MGADHIIARALFAALVLAGQGAVAQAPADDVQELVMVTGADFLLQVTSDCTSMLLRGSPIPPVSYEILEGTFDYGTLNMSLETEAPFSWGQAEMTVSYFGGEDQTTIDCEGSTPLEPGSMDVVWGALHRHSRGVGALLWGVDLGEAPDILSIQSCLEGFPLEGFTTELEARFVRPESGDTVRFSANGISQENFDGCLELE